MNLKFPSTASDNETGDRNYDKTTHNSSNNFMEVGN